MWWKSVLPSLILLKYYSFKTPTQARRCGKSRCLPLLWQGVGGGEGKEEITRKLPTNENDRASIGPQPLAYLGPFTVLPLSSSTSCLLTYTLLLLSDKLLQSTVYHLWSNNKTLVLAHFAPKPASRLSCYDLESADNTWRHRAFELRTNIQHLLQSNFEAFLKSR